MANKFLEVNYNNESFLLEVSYNNTEGLLDVNPRKDILLDENFLKSFLSPNLRSENFDNGSFISNNFVKMIKNWFIQLEQYLNQTFITKYFVREKVFKIINKNPDKFDILEDVYINTYCYLLKFPSPNSYSEILQNTTINKVSVIENSYNKSVIAFYNDTNTYCVEPIIELMSNIFKIIDYSKLPSRRILIAPVSKKTLVFLTDVLEIISVDTTYYDSTNNLNTNLTIEDIYAHFNR